MYFSLPQEYRIAKPDELKERIKIAKENFGTKLTVMAHHYQRVEVVKWADHIGDSYGLSKIAAEQKRL